MFYINQFDNFDPLKGDVSNYPIMYLPEITRRARALFLCRHSEEIERMAKRASNEIDDFFSHALELEIYRLETEMTPEDDEFELYFEWDGGTAKNGRWFFKSSMVNDLGIPNEENTSEVDALKLVIVERDDCFFKAVETDPLEYPEGKDYELFAAMGLWLVADSIRLMEIKQILGANTAIKAMEAVCYAERLKETDFLVSRIKKRSEEEMNEALTKQKSEHRKWIQHCLDVKREREAQKNSNRAKDLNDERHKTGRAAKSMVEEAWGKNPSQFPSAERAGIYYADWLEKNQIFYLEKGKQMFYQQRAVTGWIRAHAKLLGVKFR